MTNNSRERVFRTVKGVLGRVDRAWFAAKLRAGLLGPVEIVAYRGHGSADGGIFLRGRVLELVGLQPPGPKHRRRRNLANMGRRFISKEVPRARVRATVLGQTVETRADAEGFFQARFELAGSSPGEALSDTGWHPVDLELLWPTARATISGGEVRERGWALVPVRAAFAVVSDLDDTVIQTGATSLLTMLRTVLLNDASTRLPFDGVAPFYEALRLGTAGTSENPIFYVSNGPWNLYDLTEEFLNLNGVPAGPIFLRDWGPFNLKDHRGKHKTGVIRSLLETYPDLRFVLVGDSGEADPEIYARVIKEHPDRIIAAYIRDVATSPKRDAAVRAIAEALLRDTGVEMLLVPDSGTAAEHAARIGLIPPDTPRLVHVATKS